MSVLLACYQSSTVKAREYTTYTYDTFPWIFVNFLIHFLKEVAKEVLTSNN